MLTIRVKLKSASPISFSKPIEEKPATGQTHDDFARSVWREHLHYNKDGQVFIPPMALKNCLSDVAKYLGERIPGKGQSTYTKNIEAGVMVTEPLMLGVHKDEVVGEQLFLPSDGKRGGGKRVFKTYPVIAEWEAEATIYLLDPVLIGNPEKIREFLEHAGKFIGMGRFRPRNNGFYGRFTVEGFQVLKEAKAA